MQVLTHLCGATLFAVFTMGAWGQTESGPSVVKVHATQRLPSLSRPWSRRAPRDLSGSGVIIEGNRILTNAHVVNYASQIYVQAYQSADKVPAQIAAFNLGVDLAVLTVDDASFFEERPALPIDCTLPRVGDAITAYGYPIGGQKLSVTAGIVSRIDFGSVGHAFDSVTRLQIDAAINPGNSGGPAVIGGEVVGIATARLEEGDDVGYVIAAEEIQHFLETTSGFTDERKPFLPVNMSTPENPALRRYLQLDAKDTGLLVFAVRHPDAAYPLQELDVITHVGDQALDNEGRVALRDDLRISFKRAVAQAAKDGQVEVTIIRAGTRQSIQVPVQTASPPIVQLLHGHAPRYFIYGPFVFIVPPLEFVSGVVSKHAMQFARRGSPLLTDLIRTRADEDEELVMVATRPLSHTIMKGYAPEPYAVVDSVNGVRIRSLRHLVETLRDLDDEFVIFEFADETPLMVFDRQEIESATEEILEENGIRHRCSPDLRDAWSE